MTALLAGPHPRRRRRFHWIVPVVVLSGLVATLALFLLVRQAELASFHTRLESDATQQTDTIVNKIDDSLLVVMALRTYFATHDEVTRAEFASFSGPFLKERGEIKALSWNPRVPRDQRARFEAEGQGLSRDFFLYQRDANGTRVPAEQREFLYPVWYIEPVAENGRAIGFDVGSNAVRAAALEKARDTGKPAATERIMLVQDGLPEPSVLVFHPLYASGLPAATVEQRRLALKGFAVAVLNVGKLLKAALGSTGPPGLCFDLVDLTAAADRRLLHRWAPGPAPRASWRAPLLPEVRGIEKKFSFCGRTWGANFTPTKVYLARNYRLAYLAVLPVGGILTALLGLYFHTLSARRRELEEQVLERTAKLNDSDKKLRQLNAHLEQRVLERTGQLEAAMEALSHAKERAETASRAKSAFLANMSHEIRTPLNAVLGFSQIAMHDETLSPEHRHNLEIVNRSGEQLLALLNDVIAVAKIDAGRMSPAKAPFDLPALISQVVEQFAPRAAAKQLQLVNDCDGDLPRYLIGDQEKIRHILAKLIDNALKFTRQGGVAVRSRSMLRDGQGWLEVEVEDSGPGIAPEDGERIFDVFEQAGASRTNQGGTGLGLAVGREYARLMGGDLTVTSEPGRGSRFRLALPAPEAAAAPGLEASERPRRNGEAAAPVEFPVCAELDRELALLPPDLCDRLVAAARALDKSSLVELTAPVASAAPEVAKRLRSLADSYRFDLIEELIGRRTIPPTGQEST